MSVQSRTRVSRASGRPCRPTGRIVRFPLPHTGLAISSCVATSSQVYGQIFASNYAGNTPAELTTAVGDMQTAYNTAAGEGPVLPADTELEAGQIGGMTLQPAIYKWSSGVDINADLTLDGNCNDTYVFEIACVLFSVLSQSCSWLTFLCILFS